MKQKWRSGWTFRMVIFDLSFRRPSVRSSVSYCQYEMPSAMLTDIVRDITPSSLTPAFPAPARMAGNVPVSENQMETVACIISSTARVSFREPIGAPKRSPLLHRRLLPDVTHRHRDRPPQHDKSPCYLVRQLSGLRWTYGQRASVNTVLFAPNAAPGCRRRKRFCSFSPPRVFCKQGSRSRYVTAFTPASRHQLAALRE